MTASANAQDLEVDPTGLRDGGLVFPALRLKLVTREVPAWNVDLALRHVHVVEEILAHVAVIAVETPRIQPDVFVEVEGLGMGEVQALFPMEPHELPVDSHGCGARGETQDRPRTRFRALTEQGCDPSGHVPGDGLVVRKDGDRDAFEATERR